MKRSKLHLQRQTLRRLTRGALGGVIGGVTGDTQGAVKSYVMPTGTIDPCRKPEPTDLCTIASADCPDTTVY